MPASGTLFAEMVGRIKTRIDVGAPGRSCFLQLLHYSFQIEIIGPYWRSLSLSLLKSTSQRIMNVYPISFSVHTAAAARGDRIVIRWRICYWCPSSFKFRMLRIGATKWKQ